jgi:hypothetical protein
MQKPERNRYRRVETGMAAISEIDPGKKYRLQTIK